MPVPNPFFRHFLGLIILLQHVNLIIAVGGGFDAEHEQILRELRSANVEKFVARREHSELFAAGHSHQISERELESHTDEFVIEPRDRTKRTAEAIAEELGFEQVRPVRGLDGFFILKKHNVHKRSKRELVDLSQKLHQDKRVTFSEGLTQRTRVKRDFHAIQVRSSETPGNGGKNGNHHPGDPELSMFNDELWPKQWQLHDTRKLLSVPKLDLHVIGAWKLNITGRGVVVSIVDDGLLWNHTDIYQNYDPKASYDFNDDDPDPTPTNNEYNKHGSKCAGEVAMVANNSKCGVGIAFNSKIGAMRVLDGPVTDLLESEALSFGLDHIDIMSASWGPNDDGKTVDGPGKLGAEAILKGIREGRKGKGIIYVWASGNGGGYGDNCDCDGYTDSIYTLSINSASQAGQAPWYSEMCPSTIATTYSSGTREDQKIVTIDFQDKCTDQFTGTSAASPLAAGIVALGLEANGNLTWRDVQHITVWTSEPAPLWNNGSGWIQNGAGFYYNTKFGFGLMNAESWVKSALKWSNVPKQRNCTTFFPTFKPRKFGYSNPLKMHFETDACAKQKNNEVVYAEHVQVVIDLQYSRRGSLAIYLTSPSGSKIQILTKRKLDISDQGFTKWPFTTLHTWGENPAGNWTLEIRDEGQVNEEDSGKINNVTLIVYGTKEQPENYKTGKRHYNFDYNNVANRRELHAKKEDVVVLKPIF